MVPMAAVLVAAVAFAAAASAQLDFVGPEGASKLFELPEEADYFTASGDPGFIVDSNFAANAFLRRRLAEYLHERVASGDEATLEAAAIGLRAAPSPSVDENEANDDRNSDMDENLVPVVDLNAHLRAGGLNAQASAETDIEAMLSELAGSLNQALPNTSNRSELVARLLSSYFAARNSGAAGNNQLANDKQQLQLITNTNNDNNNFLSQHQQKQQFTGSEYIDSPLALVGHQLVQGGAGEGSQLLGPDGTFENEQVIKSSDHALPAYCDPPNPCPIGYTAADGCLEDFVNSASFSREYQARKECSCDNEHSLFNCAAPTTKTSTSQTNSNFNDNQDKDQDDKDHEDKNQENKADQNLNTLARTIENRYGGVAGVGDLFEGRMTQVD